MAAPAMHAHNAQPEIPDGARHLKIAYVARATVHPDPEQPRVEPDAELRESIRTSGILQPLIVRPHPDLKNEWMIVDGGRRYIGSEGVLEDLPVVLRRDQGKEYERLKTQLVANTGKPLTPIEEAKAFARMLAAREESTVEQLAKDLGRPRSSIGERLQLLELGPWVPLIETGRVPVSYAVRTLVPLRGVPPETHDVAIAEALDGVKGEEKLADSIEDFEALVRDAYKKQMYPLVRSGRSWEPQPEFATTKHDVECSCGGVEFSYGYDGKPRRSCANPSWWKPLQKEARKKARAKNAVAPRASTPAAKGGKELYLPADAATVSAGYGSSAKGVITLTDDQGRWDIGSRQGDDGFDPADLVINDAKLVRVTSQYGSGPKVGTKDAAAVKAAREKWAARWAARERELTDAFRARVEASRAAFAVTGPGVPRLVAVLADALAEAYGYGDDDVEFGDYAAAAGLDFPEKIAAACGRERRKTVDAWIAEQQPGDLELLAIMIAMGGNELPKTKARDEQKAAADAIGKQASPWTKKPKDPPPAPAAKQGAEKPSGAKKAPAAAKQAARRAPMVAFMKPLQPSPALAAVVGFAPMPRTEVTKRIWDYIRKHDLQDKKNRRQINADDALRPVFGGKASVSLFDMTKLINAHLAPVATAAAGRAPAKKKRAGKIEQLTIDEAIADVAPDPANDDVEESGDAWDMEDDG